MVKISACVIVKNEEKNLPRWLESVKRLAEEIIVVDTGSSDATVSIAEAAGAKVFHFPWIDDFAAAKNFALEQASGDWVIFPDADETFTAEDAPKVREWIRRVHRDRRVIGLLCRCVNLDMSRGGAVRNVILQARIFRRRPDLRYRGAVHEVLEYQGPEAGELRSVTDFCLYHTGYSGDVLPEKLRRDLAILLRQREKNGPQQGDAFYLADCYYGLGDFEKTMAYAREAIASNLCLVGRESRPYALLIQSLVSLGRPLVEIRAAVADAEEAYPTVGDFAVLGGLGAQQAGDYQLAETYFRRGIDKYAQAEEAPARILTADDRENLWGRALAQLGSLVRQRGNDAEALDYFVAALRRAPYQGEILTAVGRLLVGLPAVDIVAFLRSVYSLPQDAAFLLSCLLPTPLPEVCLYLDRQAGEHLPAFDRYRLAGRSMAAAALAAETAAAFARLGRWLYARDPSLANLAMLLSRTEEKTALSL